MAPRKPLNYKDAKNEKWRFRGKGALALHETLREALRRLGDFKMNGSILVTIRDRELTLSLLCDTHEEEEALAPVLCEIRCLVEEHLASARTEELAVSFNH